MQVKGWLIYVPETLSIAFLPAQKDCIGGELLDWQILTTEQTLQLFISHFKPKVESSGPCRCYFIDAHGDSLEKWFANNSRQPVRQEQESASV